MRRSLTDHIHSFVRYRKIILSLMQNVYVDVRDLPDLAYFVAFS